MKKINLKQLIIIILIMMIIWFLRPFFQPLVMGFVISPLKAIFIIAIIVGIVVLLRKFGKINFIPSGAGSYTMKASNKVPALVTAGYIFGLLILIIALNFEGEIRLLFTSKQYDFTTRQDLPTFEPIRLTPKQVATRYAEDSFQSPQEHLGDSQIAIIDGKLKRVFPRLPDGTLLYFLNKMSGFVTVDVDTLERKVSIDNQEFMYSEGVGIFDNIYFQLLKKNYFVTYTNQPIYLKDDNGKWVTVVPYTKYHGFLFTVPYWGGVAVVDSAGKITDYTPEQAQNISYLKGNRIFPKEIAEYYAEAYSYRGGLINKWFLHKNQIELVSLPGEEKIFHVPTTEGLKQLLVAEPYGRSYGIYKIFIFDSTTGKREIINYDQNSQLTGPVAAADYIKKEFPTYNWNSFSLAEPRPLNLSGDLYWLLSIIPNDAAGIAKTVFFDAKTNKVVGVDTEDQVNQFIKNGSVPVVQAAAPASTGNSVQVALDKINQIEKEVQDLKALLNTNQ